MWLYRVTSLALAMLSTTAFAQDTDNLTPFPKQMDENSCQSYSLALALHMEDPDGPYRLDTSNPDKFAASLGYRESAIRKLVWQQMRRGQRDASNRIDWARAVQVFTGNRYTLVSKNKYNIHEYFRLIERHFGIIHCQDNLTCPRSRIDSSKNGTHIRPLLISMLSIESNTYLSGHVVTITGYDDNYESPTGGPWLPRLRVVNSSTAPLSYCGPKIGVEKWITKYTPTSWVGRRLYYNLAWIEPVAR